MKNKTLLCVVIDQRLHLETWDRDRVKYDLQILFMVRNDFVVKYLLKLYISVQVQVGFIINDITCGRMCWWRLSQDTVTLTSSREKQGAEVEQNCEHRVPEMMDFVIQAVSGFEATSWSLVRYFLTFWSNLDNRVGNKSNK